MSREARVLTVTLLDYLQLEPRDVARWPNLEKVIAAALADERARVFKEVEARCYELATLNQKAHQRALKAGREGVAMCRQSDCETLDRIGLWCRARGKVETP